MSKVNTAKQSILEPSQKSSLKIDGVSTKRVKFDRLELQEYPYELGDNPSTYDGPPLTIAWKPQLSITYDIDFFEKFERTTSRPMEGLSIPGVERIRLLNMSGFSNQEISKVMRECKKIQRFRENSINGMHWDFFAAASESSRAFLSSSLGRFKTAVQHKNLARTTRPCA